MYIPNNVLDITLYNGLTLTKCVVQLKVLVRLYRAYAIMQGCSTFSW